MMAFSRSKGKVLTKDAGQGLSDIHGGVIWFSLMVGRELKLLAMRDVAVRQPSQTPEASAYLLRNVASVPGYNGSDGRPPGRCSLQQSRFSSSTPKQSHKATGPHQHLLHSILDLLDFQGQFEPPFIFSSKSHESNLLFQIFSFLPFPS